MDRYGYKKGSTFKRAFLSWYGNCSIKIERVLVTLLVSQLGQLGIYEKSLTSKKIYDKRYLSGVPLDT